MTPDGPAIMQNYLESIRR
ncbi:MAG: hypothetical protein ACLUEQ_11695 [Cloacibacillus evryensis]